MRTGNSWTTRGLLAWMGEAFGRAGLDSPRLCAEILLAHVLGCERLRLYMEVDRPASEPERAALRDLVRRALNHEPVQYLTGEAWFFGLPLHVDKRVLIPRPATETIVEHVIQDVRSRWGPDGEGVTIADVCTGSGCIAIALAKHLSRARVIATDVRAEALDVARRNVERHGVEDRVELIEGDLLAPIRDRTRAAAEGELTYFVANPPYIPDDEWADVPRNVKDHEPRIALRGGRDGLDVVRRLAREAPEIVRDGGRVLIEVASSRAEAARGLVQAHARIGHAFVVCDHEGLARVVVGHVVASLP